MADRAGLPAHTLKRIRNEVRGLRTLRDAVRWGATCDPARVVVNVVVQDELTQDVVIAFGEGLFLAFDTTSLGGLSQVGVWNYRPSAYELLWARLHDGWVPTPTPLKAGRRVLGLAAEVTSAAA